VRNAIEQVFRLRFRVVDLNGNGVLFNDFLNGRLRILPGLPRMASPSTRVENVEQDEFRLAARLRERLVIRMQPIHASPLSHKAFVDVTPSPILSRLKRSHHRMARLLEMLGCVAVLRAVAASYVPAVQTLAQVHPCLSRFETLFATMRRGGDVLHFIEMGTRLNVHGGCFAPSARFPEGRA
jgi:hypothetical protein